MEPEPEPMPEPEPSEPETPSSTLEVKHRIGLGFGLHTGTHAYQGISTSLSGSQLFLPYYFYHLDEQLLLGAQLRRLQIEGSGSGRYAYYELLAPAASAGYLWRWNDFQIGGQGFFGLGTVKFRYNENNTDWPSLDGNGWLYGIEAVGLYDLWDSLHVGATFDLAFGGTEIRYTNNTTALITASITDPTKQKGALKAFRYARRLVYGKLRRTIRRDKKKGSISFLTDPEQYNYLVALFKAGRVFAVRGDLTATRTMRDLAKVMKQFNRPLRTLYISNCEQYFSFGDDYRQNIAVQHPDERSLILRTRPWRKRSKEETDQLAPIQYTFMTQDFPTMRAWMNNKKTKKLYDMIHYHKVPNRLVRLTRLPKTTRSK